MPLSHLQAVEKEKEAGNKTAQVYNTKSKVATKKGSEWKGEFVTTPTVTHIYEGAGTTFDSLLVLPTGTTVKADAGYYTPTESPDGCVWLYCRNIDKVNDKTVTGFVYSAYLKKK